MIEELEKLLQGATLAPWTVLKSSQTEEGWISQLTQGYDGELPIVDLELICLLRNNAEKILTLLKTAQNLQGILLCKSL